ncbi:MAG: hypothetical protein HXY20_04340 [Acidobacteria bacterium]|nr:hypothetical protein [Acidobacteriota bacterium]
MNLPDYQVLPAPLWLITSLHLLTLALHFIAMNFVVGGLVLVLAYRAQDRWCNPVILRFVRLFPIVMAATVTFGVAPLLFLQLVYGRFIYAASIVSAWFWLAVVGVVIASYYALYAASFSNRLSARKVCLAVALIGAVYVSLAYSSVFSMMERPELVKQLYAEDQSGLVWNPRFKDYLLRWLHMMAGALTIGGFFASSVAVGNPASPDPGRRFFLWGMVLGFLTGLAYLFSLGEVIGPFMRSPAIWVLAPGLVLSLLSVWFYHRRNLVIAGGALSLSMLAMVFSRHSVRLLQLEGHFDPSAVPVRPQWTVFALFLVCFLVALILGSYMLRVFFRRAESRQT